MICSCRLSILNECLQFFTNWLFSMSSRFDVIRNDVILREKNRSLIATVLTDSNCLLDGSLGFSGVESLFLRGTISVSKQKKSPGLRVPLHDTRYESQTGLEVKPVWNFISVWRHFPTCVCLHATPGMKPIPVRISLNSGKTIWKAAHGLLCPTLQSLFKKKSSISFHLPFKRLDVSQNSIFYSGVRSWNTIPAKIRASPSVNSFKMEYKNYLLKSIANWLIPTIY